MKRLRSKILLLSAPVLLSVAIPASSQDAPESLLPPGFGNTPPPPAPPPPTGAPGQQAPPPSDQQQAPPASEEGPALVETTSPEDIAQAQVAPPRPLELPTWARRSPDVVGPLTPANWGFSESAWGGADGRFLSVLMRRLDAPIPSRWGSILLRRALLSRVPTPRGVSPADWVAERAWLLLRMGEADSARMLVEAVDVEDFTPKMFQVAVQSALADADPAALCPLAGPGKDISDEPVWQLSDAMCAALQGDASRASGLIDDARRHSPVTGIDLLLAEKVVGAGVNTRRAVTIQWDGVDGLNSWRFGLASATGLAIPDSLMDAAPSRMQAWLARAPMIPPDQRLKAADTAASLGVFSSASLVELYSLITDSTDPSDLPQSVGGRLHDAYTARDVEARMTALRSLWSEAKDPVQRHARLILTATAAARIPPSGNLSHDAADLIASMLCAGLDRRAERWSAVVDGMDASSADRPWAMLALASPDLGVRVSPGRVSSFADRDDSPGRIRARMLLAALAGLDRITPSGSASLARDLGVHFDNPTVWTVVMDRAAEKRQQATVALLAAAGMQANGWRGVPPDHFYHIIRDLRLVGLDYEARMIAAEAMARL